MREVAASAGCSPNTEEFEQFDIVSLRYLVEPVTHLLGEVGEELDKGDARVAVVPVGPLRRVDRDAAKQGVVRQRRSGDRLVVETE